VCPNPVTCKNSLCSVETGRILTGACKINHALELPGLSVSNRDSKTLQINFSCANFFGALSSVDSRNYEFFL
jgi:hypothetical protein